MKPHIFIEPICIFLLSLLLFSNGISRFSIYILDESKNAQCSYEMMTTGDGIVPTFNGQLRTDKPPLHYYFMMAGYIIWGKTNTGARFFSGFVGSLFMLAFYLFLKKYASIKIARYSILALWSSLQFVVEFHLAVPDPYLITFVGLCLMSFYHALQSQSRWGVYGLYVFMGLACLAKGPIAIFLPGLIMLVYMLISKQLSIQKILQLKPIVGFLIFASIVSPWYYLVGIKTNGEWLRGFFMEHNIDRFSEVKEGHGGFFLLTLLYYILGFIPFIFFLPNIIKHCWKTRTNSLILFSALTTLLFILFFTFSQTKLPNYAMPAYPFTAILIGHWISQQEFKQISWTPYLGYLILSLLLIATEFIAINIDPNLNGLHKLIWILVPLPLGAITGLAIALKRKKKIALNIIIYSQIATGILLTSWGFGLIDQRNPITQSKDIVSNANQIAFCGSINPAFIFKYGLIKQLKSNSEASQFISLPGHVLITTQGELDKQSWPPYNLLFQSTDLFDSRKTRIIKSK